MSKKTFKPNLPASNPAMQFITQPSIENTAVASVSVASAATSNMNAMNEVTGQAIKQKQLKPESRDKRLQLLLQPSLYQAIKAQADGQGRSVNDLIHEVFSAYCQK
jgi:predicted HicB family RNase H-like nuclease